MSCCLFTSSVLATTTSVAINANNTSSNDITCSYTTESGTTATTSNNCDLSNSNPGNTASPYITYSSNTSTDPQGNLTLYMTNTSSGDDVALCTAKVSLAETAIVKNYYPDACSLSVAGNAYVITIHNVTTSSK
ncbi:MAG: hypothetical protein HWD59_09150 [Coxiellaceae bacterium]|nr:MAG: hypothetical protein HWD59_09150 [Coxiellaceae bacterium]